MTPEEAARRWQARRTAQARRDVELETFPTTGGSRSLNSSPMYGDQGRRPVQAPAVEELEEDVSGVGLPGETITVVAESVAISTSPVIVEYDSTWGDVAGFVNADLGAGELTPTYEDAYYDIQVEIVRGAYSGDVKVEVLRGDTVVWPPPASVYWDDPAVPVSAKGRLSRPA